MTYQGNKGEYSTRICNLVKYFGDRTLPFWDICCGSGQISSFWAEPNYMVDIGPWGRFWQTITEDRLILDSIINSMKGKSEKELAQVIHLAKMQPVPQSNYLFACHFIVLQTFAFNGKPVMTHGSSWKHPGFPHRFSPNKLMKELERIARTKVLKAHWLDANNFVVPEKAKVYIDPDYKGTQGYGHSESARGGKVNHTFDVPAFVHLNRHCDLFVSHHEPIKLGGGIHWDEIKDITIEGVRRKKQSTELLHIRKADA